MNMLHHGADVEQQQRLKNMGAEERITGRLSVRGRCVRHNERRTRSRPWEA